MINTYDIDGVINMGKYKGLTPQYGDIIITGRSFEEKKYTNQFLCDRGIYNTVFYSPEEFNSKTREKSGIHKANVINMLVNSGITIGIHFEDDPIQADIIKTMTPVQVVLVVSDLVEKENVWHGNANDKPST